MSIFLCCFKVVTSFTSAQCQLSVKSSEGYLRSLCIACSMKWMLGLLEVKWQTRLYCWGSTDLNKSWTFFLSSWLESTFFSMWIMADTVGRCFWLVSGQNLSTHTSCNSLWIRDNYLSHSEDVQGNRKSWTVEKGIWVTIQGLGFLIFNQYLNITRTSWCPLASAPLDNLANSNQKQDSLFLKNDGSRSFLAGAILCHWIFPLFFFF